MLAITSFGAVAVKVMLPDWFGGSLFVKSAVVTVFVASVVLRMSFQVPYAGALMVTAPFQLTQATITSFQLVPAGVNIWIELAPVAVAVVMLRNVIDDPAGAYPCFMSRFWPA